MEGETEEMLGTSKKGSLESTKLHFMQSGGRLQIVAPTLLAPCRSLREIAVCAQAPMGFWRAGILGDPPHGTSRSRKRERE